MASDRVTVDEADIIRLTLEFLEEKGLFITQLALERETNITNPKYSDDVLFLRQLIFDGQWDQALDYLAPLQKFDEFDGNSFQFHILKHKFLELVCLRSEASDEDAKIATAELSRCLDQLRPYCPNQHEYKTLASLSSQTRLTDHVAFTDWNPSASRAQCFKAIFPVVEPFLESNSSAKNLSESSTNQRLLQLLVKGLLYEASVEYCQAKATGLADTPRRDTMLGSVSGLLQVSPSLGDADASLTCWLRSVPNSVFEQPFEQRKLQVDVRPLRKPQLESSWSEHILMSPISPVVRSSRAVASEDRRVPSDSPPRRSNQRPDRTSAGLSTSSEAFQDYLQNKGRLQQELVEQEKRRENLQKQLNQLNSSTPRLSSYSAFADTPLKTSAIAEAVTPSVTMLGTPENGERHVDKKPIGPITKTPKLTPNGASPPQPRSPFLDASPATATTSTRLTKSPSPSPEEKAPRPRFVPVTTLEDVQAIRAVEVHPSGDVYALGANSKTLRLCRFPDLMKWRLDGGKTQNAEIVAKKHKHHKGSIYCLAWNPTGDLIASGSNDKTIKLCRYNASNQTFEGGEMELTHHDGTVRDMCFMEDVSNHQSLLISGGAGDCKVYVTDCATGVVVRALSGHAGHIYSLYTWGGCMFVSGSQDKTIRFWDLRSSQCVNVLGSANSLSSQDLWPAPRRSPVASLCVDRGGRVLASGHEDAFIMIYDIRSQRVIQNLKPHAGDVRSVRFSKENNFLLTGSYDQKMMVIDVRGGDLAKQLPCAVVAEHSDKVIQCRWHPSSTMFVSTSADRTAVCWSLPPM